MAEKKEREDSNTEIWISGEQKKLLRWNKKHFPVFKGISFDTSFKQSFFKVGSDSLWVTQSNKTSFVFCLYLLPYYLLILKSTNFCEKQTPVHYLLLLVSRFFLKEPVPSNISMFKVYSLSYEIVLLTFLQNQTTCCWFLLN